MNAIAATARLTRTPHHAVRGDPPLWPAFLHHLVHPNMAEVPDPGLVQCGSEVEGRLHPALAVTRQVAHGKCMSGAFNVTTIGDGHIPTEAF